MQAKMTADFHPWRRNVDFLECTDTPIRPLVDQLDFIVFAEHPDQRRDVCQDRPLLTRRRRDAAVRAHGPARRALDGKKFRVLRHHRAGRRRDAAAVGGANRDPRRFVRSRHVQHPRNEGAHLTFGKGLHYCLGANLARLEGRVALDDLLNRWPEWDIDYETADWHRPRPSAAGSGCASYRPENRAFSG
jgi:hypothetical protein